MSWRLPSVFTLLIAGLLGCDDSIDVQQDAAVKPDASIRDATTPQPDAARPDAEPLDAATRDAETSELGTDAAAMDADPADLDPADLDLPELPDAAEPDAGEPDAEPTDVEDLDAGPSADAGPPICTVSPSSCANGEVCLGTSCSCIQALEGQHYLRTDGTVVNWLGTPIVITVAGGAPLSEIIEIYTGSGHGCALRADGTVWCWPFSSLGDSSGQLGDGTATANTPLAAYNIATQVYDGAGLPLSQIEHLSRGSSRGYLASNTCAIRQNGSVWCWGSSDSSGGGGGSLYTDGLPGGRPFAVEILAAAATSLTGVQAVSLGLRHACLIRNGTTNGELWCWGANVGGPLGQGDQNGRQYPTQVALPGPADQVGAGADLTCARVADAVYCWGSNNSGQVGIGPPSDPANHDGCINFCKLTPDRVIDLNDAPLDTVVDLEVGYLSNCAKKADHSLWCWGNRTAVSRDERAVLAVVNGKNLDDVALVSTQGTSGYAQTLLYLERDAELFRVSAQETPLCP